MRRGLQLLAPPSSFQAGLGSRFPRAGVAVTQSRGCAHRIAWPSVFESAGAQLHYGFLQAQPFAGGVPLCPKSGQKPGVTTTPRFTPAVLSLAGGKPSWMGLWCFFFFLKHCNICFTL